MGRLDRVKDWDGLEMNAGYRVGKAAELCDVDPRSIRRFFRKRFGAAPLEYFMRQRMGKAVELLQDPALEVKEVADLSGYGSHVPLFCRHFKKFFGVRPSEIREIDPRSAGKIEKPVDRSVARHSGRHAKAKAAWLRGSKHVNGPSCAPADGRFDSDDSPPGQNVRSR